VFVGGFIFVVTKLLDAISVICFIIFVRVALSSNTSFNRYFLISPIIVFKLGLYSSFSCTSFRDFLFIRCVASLNIAISMLKMNMWL